MSRLVDLAKQTLNFRGIRDDDGSLSYEDALVVITGDAFCTVTYVGYRAPHGFVQIYSSMWPVPNTKKARQVIEHLERVLVLEELAGGVAEGPELGAVEDGPAGQDHPPSAR